MRLRAPQDHGQTLQLPPLANGPGIVKSNHRVISNYPAELIAIRDIARSELTQFSFEYSRRYSNVSAPANSETIVMAGHQPTLFHPGVWFKNFALDSVGHSCSATAINLVVDNDLCTNTSVSCPQFNNEGTVSLHRVSYDNGADGVPFEMQRLTDRDTFQNFGQRIASSIRDVVASPLIDALWPEVLHASENLNLQMSIAAGRHRLEQKHGINNLELPVSLMSTSQSFAMFVERIVLDAKRFVEIHNDALAEYRHVHRIRSRSHPVPELESDGQWHEVPFWIWTIDSPNRRRLFARLSGGAIELSDRAGWSMSFGQNNFVSSFQSMNELASEVFVRPRALTTTMFSRLFACDLFLHGIGGAKYDQLSDVIMGRFLEITPPKFMTMTATMKLPFDFENTSTQNVTEFQVELRRLRYHPELRLAKDEAADRKRKLIENPPASGSRKTWRDEIAAINDSLFDSLQVQRQDLEEKIAFAKAALPVSKILDSREFSFALFPESLIEQLRELSIES